MNVSLLAAIDAVVCASFVVPMCSATAPRLP
jgi:hypothetical protein